jgi:hypothetical protein
MTRPGVGKKLANPNPDHEPDLYKISEMHPVPERPTDDSILLQCTLEGGPKARMPIYSGAMTSKPLTLADFKKPSADSQKAAAFSLTAPIAPQLTPWDQEALAAFQQSLGASETQLKNLTVGGSAPVPVASQPTIMVPPSMFATNPGAPISLPANSVAAGPNKVSTLAAANQLAFVASPSAGGGQVPDNLMAAFQASSAASQFAAGFAAAAALSHQQFQSMLGSMSAGIPQQQLQQQQQQQQPCDTNSDQSMGT